MASLVNTFIKKVLKNQLITQQVRFYPRWNHRRPLKVYSPEEYEEIEKKNETTNSEKTIFDKYGGLKTSWNQPQPTNFNKTETIKYEIKSKKRNQPLIATHQKSKVTPGTDMLETIIDGNGNFIYTKMKNNDVRISCILTELKSKKEKEKRDLILLEGKRLIKDALEAGCHLKYILFSRMEEINYLKPYLPKGGAQLYKMPYKEMQMWSDLTTTPGIMAIFKTPDTENFICKNPLPVTIICDNIREPGNLGSVLRISAAVGCERVILSKGCVNLWDTKVLRGSVGSHFKLRLYKNLKWHEISNLISPEANFFIADNKLVSDKTNSLEKLDSVLDEIPLLPYYGVDFCKCKEIVLVVGGETHGISKESYELALRNNGARLNIPLSNDVDSLNVGAALGIIAFEIRKQLTSL